MNRRVMCVALLPLVLLGCDQKTPQPEQPPSQVATPLAAPPGDRATPAFRHDGSLDLFGYYIPQEPVQVGNWRLKSVNLASPSDFAAWEDGKRPSNFAPFFLEFEDVSSPTAENELGQVYHSVSVRLLPQRYSVGAGQVTFGGADPRLGEVTFSGGLDLPALEAVKAAGPGGEARSVLTGELRIGAKRLRSLGFIYFAGD